MLRRLLKSCHAAYPVRTRVPKSQLSLVAPWGAAAESSWRSDVGQLARWRHRLRLSSTSSKPFHSTLYTITVQTCKMFVDDSRDRDRDTSPPNIDLLLAWRAYLTRRLPSALHHRAQ